MAPTATEVQAFGGPRTWLLGVTLMISQNMKEKRPARRGLWWSSASEAANKGPRKEKKEETQKKAVQQFADELSR